MCSTKFLKTYYNKVHHYACGPPHSYVETLSSIVIVVLGVGAFGNSTKNT